MYKKSPFVNCEREKKKGSIFFERTVDICNFYFCSIEINPNVEEIFTCTVVK